MTGREPGENGVGLHLPPRSAKLQLRTNKGTLDEYLPATTFGAPASTTTAGHVGWRKVSRNRSCILELLLQFKLELQLWTNGTLEEYLPATTFGAPASSTAGHVGWREVARNRGIMLLLLLLLLLGVRDS